ncbi:carcinine transporter isoform X2 [Anthonomus grandis grandis]|nr:carcinine transporter isoform X2 [Anthonomus grandis grandis]XP_050302735.1 carcinine transporter isoform X2 [Anthonomus grandis grandis]XP_050302741.1 carcinine transporter isoform X2 [Anthonomus grandis grandis]XP_050302750.1 carcinine transporter isoform X2 [Anthonomus grandis grandis]XP_050302758.1 carcinine transporter isoform X2 [Anthonomus grandis grandis]
MDLDDILPQIGEFGKYQKLMLWLICLPACFPCGFCAFNQLFMTEVPPHWCHVPELANLTVEERKNLSIPRVNGSYASCQRYVANYTAVLSQLGEDEMVNNSLWALEGCKDGYEYDTSVVYSSIVLEYDLVCDKDIYPTLGLVSLNFGGPFGVYLFGYLNDRIGRKKTFFICLTTLIVGGVLTALSPDFWWWAAARLIVGLTIPAIYQIPFIISLELVGPNYRSFITVLTCLFYTVGLIMLSGITYLVRDWKYLSLLTSLPFVLYYLYWFVLPESPRWLLAKGKFEEASTILESLAKTNGKELPTSFKQQLKQKMMNRRTSSEEEALNKNQGLTDLCATPNMRLKTILITLNWFANNMVYVGLSYYGPSLGSNQYISFLLSSAVEIPSYIASWLLIDKWGRRWPLCICMMLSGASCIATVLVSQDNEVATLVLFLISKSTISASFFIIYPFAGELYPTAIRGLGIGVSAYIAGVGLIIIPFVTYLGSDVLVLPIIIMGIISVFGGLCGLRLPETLHHRLPQTLEEGEEFGKNFTWGDCIRCAPIKPSASMVGSYEDLEMISVKPLEEEVPMESTPELKRKISVKKLVRQQSIMDTQKAADGTMNMTYWF